MTAHTARSPLAAAMLFSMPRNSCDGAAPAGFGFQGLGCTTSPGLMCCERALGAALLLNALQQLQTPLSDIEKGATLETHGFAASK